MLLKTESNKNRKVISQTELLNYFLYIFDFRNISLNLYLNIIVLIDLEISKV